MHPFFKGEATQQLQQQPQAHKCWWHKHDDSAL